MRKFLLLLILLFSLLSCRKATEKNELINGFATDVGQYQIGKNKFEIFSYKGGILTFAMQDENGNLLIDGHSVSSFSAYQQWKIYFDESLNLWFYNSDYQNTSVWFYGEDGEYTCYDYCKENIPVPKQFIDGLGTPLERICRNVRQTE